MIKIYNEDCFETMEKTQDKQFDIILTSPFYNTNRKAGKNLTLKSSKANEDFYSHVRYDKHVDNLTDAEYCEFTARLFNTFDRVLNTNGVVLYNLNYGAENTEGMFRAINTIITETPFTVADVIVWKKKAAVPNNCSPNRLTRIWEFVFVFCRKKESRTFLCNKKIKSRRATGQASYENKFNFIEAKNNDGSCSLNKATFSTEFCEKLFDLYVVKPDTFVYDPFIGSGTTAVACLKRGLHCVGSEISAAQCEYANERINKAAAEIQQGEDDTSWMK